MTGERLSATVFAQTIELAEIPAPTGEEGARRERVRA